LSHYTPSPLDSLSAEELPVILSQELERISQATDTRNWVKTFARINTDYNAGEAPYIFCDASSAPLSVFLPAPQDEIILNVMKIDNVNNVTIDAGPNTINGLNTQVINTQYTSLTLYWDTNEWFIVGGN